MFYKKITLSDNEKQQIRKAVEDLENESSGEIVLYLAQKSDDYSDAYWYLAALIGGAVSISLATLSYLWMLPSEYTVFEVSIFMFLSILVGFLLPFLFPRMRVKLMNDNSVTQRVMTKAHDVFLQQRVYHTIDGTGVLIFISALEHKVVVMGDEGINRQVKEEDWNKVVKHIVVGIKKGNLTSGIVEAIRDCKKLLLDNGFTVRRDDTNELKDEIIVEE